tara:strand:- start:10072 stop:12342 length:2271 start_codon:yes stop_codon:yes gene_type:complete
MARRSLILYYPAMPNIFYRNYLIFTVVLLSCVIALGYVLVVGDRQIDKSDNWVLHTHKVIIEAEEANALIAGMIATQRGYLISADEGFLEKYRDTKTAVAQHIAALYELTAYNSSQQTRLDELNRYFLTFAEQLEDRAGRSVTDTPQRILKDVETVNSLKREILRINANFLAEEYNLLNQRIKKVESKKDQYFKTLLIGGGTAFIMIMVFNGYLLRVQFKRSTAESALRESEEVFRLAVEGTQDGVFDWNIKTGEVFYSDQFMATLGYKPSEFEGTFNDFSSKIHPEEIDRVQEYIDLYLDNQLSEYSNTFRIQHKSGRWIWVNSRAKLIRDKKGQPVRLVGAHTDVSAAKEYELRLQEAKTSAEDANRAKSAFLAHMSHEIRTPLTTISGVAEILEQNKDDLDDKRQSLIRVLNTSAVTLKDLISGVLDFSKIESGEMELEESAFALQDAFEHIVSMMAVRTKEKGLDFIFDYEDVKNIQVYGDAVRLRQILINLIGNATKFTDEGHVHVKAVREERNDHPILIISVEDTGIGVSEDQFDLVFERFKQADSSESRKHGGTGLGLPISKKLAVLMGGDIELKSEIGKGSIFTLILPLRSIEETEDQQAEDHVRQAKVNDKLKAAISNTDKVLLVEDYEGNVVVLSYILEEMGCEFDVARTGLEALKLWKDNHYDIVLMDIQMPVMDGFTATSKIREIEEENSFERTPIIGMTAHALVGDKDKCIEAGMDAYLPKPIVVLDLKSTILEFLKKKKKTA